MIVFLIFWLALLTAAIGVGFLMIVGKFARVDRALNGVYGELDIMGDSLERLMKDFKNLETNSQTSFENLLTKVKTLEENPSEVSEQITDLDTRIGNLAENLENLEGDVKLLFKADKEHPVLAPVPSKGGRPRKEQV